MAVAAPECISTDISERKSWGAMKSQRTKAIPKHSLFGTALEHVDREELKGIEGRYIPEGLVKESPNRYPLPAHIKESIPGRDCLETSRRELAAQRDAFSQAEQQLKAKSERVFAFKTSDGKPSSSQGSLHSHRPNWLSQKDLENSKDINILGLTESGSYNRDKYRKKPQVHNYSLIGDILAPKMDFNSARSDREETTQKDHFRAKNVALGPGRNLPYELMEQQNNSKKRTHQRSVIDLPPNIRHQFGSRVCDTLLSDQAIVSLALERQKSKMGPPRPSKKENIEGLPVNLKNNYESLGHTTRYNVCPGVSSGHTISRTKDEFNDEVHLKRVPNPDEYRYQRDELSTWSEHNVLRERMKKAWNEAYPLGIWVEQDVLRKRMEHKWNSYFESMPKVLANWDRNAKRPQIIRAAKPQEKPKPKVQRKPKQKPNEVPVDNEMDIIFVTPPLTPPPPEKEIVEVSKNFERDNDFWSFYDQTAP